MIDLKQAIETPIKDAIGQIGHRAEVFANNQPFSPIETELNNISNKIGLEIGKIGNFGNLKNSHVTKRS